MSIRNLRTLVAIKKYGSFQSAAEALYLSQSAVSQQIKSLEKLWDKKIFDRSNRSPQMTTVGKALTTKAEVAIKAYDNIVSSALFGDGFKGQLKLGAVPTTLTGLMPMAVNLLKQRYPELRVVIYPALSTRLMTQINRGSIDAGIIGKPELLPSGLNCLDIAAEPMQLLAPPNTTSSDPLHLLRTLPFIRFDRDALFGQMVEKWLQKNNIQVNESMELDGLEAISSMVFANLGLSIVPKSCVQSVNPLPIRRLSLGADAPTRQLGLAYNNDHPKLDVIKEVHLTLLNAVEIGEFKP